MKPGKSIRRSAQKPSGQRAEFSMVVMQFIGRLERVHQEITDRNDRMAAEWSTVRGLLTWTEERLGSVEARQDRLEAALAILPPEIVAELRGILANYGPALEALGVKPRPGSAVGDAVGPAVVQSHGK